MGPVTRGSPRAPRLRVMPFGNYGNLPGDCHHGTARPAAVALQRTATQRPDVNIIEEDSNATPVCIHLRRSLWALGDRH